MELKISIIIPTYNVETYIEECLTSVFSQSYKNYEVIVVDDGSSDQTVSVIQSLIEGKENAMLIQNGHDCQATARNTGLKKSSGDYVIFLDSDDYWGDEDALERVVKRIEETHPDVLNFSYVKVFEDGRKEPYLESISMHNYMEKSDQLRFLFAKGLYLASPCNKCIRKEILDSLWFEEGVYSEDVLWSAKLLLQANFLDYVDENFYMYRQHEGSTRYTYDEKHLKDRVQNILACIKLLETCKEEEKPYLQEFTAFQYATFFAMIAHTEMDVSDLLKQLEPNVSILSHYGSNKKVKRLYQACQIFGFKRTCQFVKRFLS